MSFLYKPKTKNGDLIKLPQVFHQVFIINGIWPTEKDDADDLKRKLYKLFGWLTFLNLTFINFCEIASFIANMTDLIKAVQSFCTAMTGLFVVLRSLHFRIFSKKFAMLLKTFSKEIWIDGNKYSHNVQKCHRVMRPVFVYFISILITCLLYLAIPIIVFFTTNQTMDSRDKLLPYPMIFPYDVQERTAYIITYILAAHGGWMIVSEFYAPDAILLLFVSFLCGQFEILNGDIVRLIPECHAKWQKRYGKNKSGNYNVQPNAERVKLLQSMYTNRLHQLSERHNQLISFNVQLNDLFALPLLINVINSTFLICFCGFQFLITGTTSLGDFLMFFFFFVSVVLQLSVICTCGDLLLSRSEETAFYLYFCNWEGGGLSEQSPLFLLPKEMDAASLNAKLPLWKSIKYYPADKDFRNKLRFMIMRSHRPLELNAMNFTIISLETLGKILSSSMSYFTLLKTFLDKQN